MPEPSIPSSSCAAKAHGRWPFIRDVLLLQLKMSIGGLHNLVLVPATTVAALLDLLFRSGPHGSRFYRVLEWGRRADEAIGLYGALDHRGDNPVKSDFTVAAIVLQLEQAIVRARDSGGTVANVKTAIDRALVQLHEKIGNATKANDTSQGTIDAVRPAPDKSSE
jgi:hypothetical protein